IRRNVPVEVQPIVSTLNALLDRVSRRISSKDEFISSAAHQLRNPIAGVLALAEAVETAPSPEAAKKRSAELVLAARDATHLTNQLLSFERAKESDIERSGEKLDLCALVRHVINRFEIQNANKKVEVATELPERPVPLIGDRVMLSEALLNVLNNSVVHGGPDISRIDITLEVFANIAKLRVVDNGIGIAPDDRVVAIGRFSQANDGPGSGLGLPIAVRVMENHGGRLIIDESSAGAALIFEFQL
ncbi:MAG: HAMP domain-containing sensor histidine kinase, partial [Paracoccaceae bacterium]